MIRIIDYDTPSKAAQQKYHTHPLTNENSECVCTSYYHYLDQSHLPRLSVCVWRSKDETTAPPVLMESPERRALFIVPRHALQFVVSCLLLLLLPGIGMETKPKQRTRWVQNSREVNFCGPIRGRFLCTHTAGRRVSTGLLTRTPRKWCRCGVGFSSSCALRRRVTPTFRLLVTAVGTIDSRQRQPTQQRTCRLWLLVWPVLQMRLDTTMEKGVKIIERIYRLFPTPQEGLGTTNSF